MIIASLIALQFAAIPGIPEIPSGQEPHFIAAWSNDWFSFPSGMQQSNQSDLDDYRTNGITLTGLTGPWRLYVDDSMLTSRALQARSDELTVTVGYDFISATMGVGARLRGDYKGQQLQNWWHSQMSSGEWHCAYASAQQDIVAYVTPWFVSHPITGRLTLDPLGSLILATNTELAGDLGCHVTYNGEGINSWFGLRYQWREGAQDELIRMIQKHERGLRIDYGFACHSGFSFSCIYDPNGATGIGTMAYSW